jgi:hypothetical protein
LFAGQIVDDNCYYSEKKKLNLPKLLFAGFFRMIYWMEEPGERKISSIFRVIGENLLLF